MRPPVYLELVGLDGNSFNLVGAWRGAAKRAGWDKQSIEEISKEAMSGDYDNLLRVLSDNCTSPAEDEDDNV